MLIIDLFDDDEHWRESLNINIEGLSSLKMLRLGLFTLAVGLSIKNLPSLKKLSLFFAGTINEEFVTRLLEQVPFIQELCLFGYLSYLSNFFNLKVLSLDGIIKESFNFELFKNLCNQFEDIKIRSISNIEEKNFFKLDCCNFPYLVDLTIGYLDMKRLIKQFIYRFPMFRQLNISKCGIEGIESDSFTNIYQLT